MPAKGNKTDVGTEKRVARRTPSKAAVAQTDKSAKTKRPSRGRAMKPGAVVTFTHEMVAERAYFISHSSERGTDEENWLRAEAELRQGV